MMSKKIIMLLFFTGISVFIAASLGTFDKISAEVSTFLFNLLGYTNKWSKTFGPSWFVNMSDNLAAFGSKEMVVILNLIFFCYLFLSDRKRDAIEFIMVILISVIFIIFIKIIISGKDLNSFSMLYSDQYGNFPSGHSFIAAILYPNIALYLSKNESNSKLKYFYSISIVFIIMIVGITMITGAKHTVTEVIAGWSLGFSWLILLKVIQLKISVNYLDKKHLK